MRREERRGEGKRRDIEQRKERDEERRGSEVKEEFGTYVF